MMLSRNGVQVSCCVFVFVFHCTHVMAAISESMTVCLHHSRTTTAFEMQCAQGMAQGVDCLPEFTRRKRVSVMYHRLQRCLFFFSLPRLFVSLCAFMEMCWVICHCLLDRERSRTLWHWGLEAWRPGDCFFFLLLISSTHCFSGHERKTCPWWNETDLRFVLLLWENKQCVISLLQVIDLFYG